MQTDAFDEIECRRRMKELGRPCARDCYVDCPLVDPSGKTSGSIPVMPVKLTGENVAHLSIWRHGQNIGWDAWSIFSTAVMTSEEASRFLAKTQWFLAHDALDNIDRELDSLGDVEGTSKLRTGLLGRRLRIMQAVDSYAQFEKERGEVAGELLTRK